MPQVLAINYIRTDSSCYVNRNEIPPPDTPSSRVGPPGSPLHIAVAPGMLDQKHTVIREPGESDERYQSRCELLAALLDHAKQG